MSKAKYTWLWQIPQLIKEHPMETKVLKMRTNENGITVYGETESFVLCLNTTDEKALNLRANTDYACIMVPIPKVKEEIEGQCEVKWTGDDGLPYMCHCPLPCPKHGGESQSPSEADGKEG